MDGIKQPIIELVGFALFCLGMLMLAKGGGALASTSNKNPNDELNMKGWKGLGSHWAGSAVLIGGGSYMMFMRWINAIVLYVLHTYA
jgi:hypothetical protein